MERKTSTNKTILLLYTTGSFACKFFYSGEKNFKDRSTHLDRTRNMINQFRSRVVLIRLLWEQLTFSPRHEAFILVAAVFLQLLNLHRDICFTIRFENLIVEMNIQKDFTVSIMNNFNSFLMKNERS